MAENKRVSVGFAPREKEQIEALVDDPEAGEVVNKLLLGGLEGTVVALAADDPDLVSISDATRKLALVGLAEVQRARRAGRYRAAAGAAVAAFSPEDIRAAGRSAMAVLDARLQSQPAGVEA